MNIKSILNLENSVSDYTNATTRDNNFELLDSTTNKLYIHDKTGKKIDEKPLNKNFKTLTYNDKENFYLMLDDNTKNTFSKLDENLNEIDTFEVDTNIPIKSTITDIFFDKVNNKYLITDRINAYSVDLQGKFLKYELLMSDFYNITIANNGRYSYEKISPDNFCFTGIGSDENYKYIAYSKNNSSYVSKISNNGSLADNLFIDDNLLVHSILHNDSIFLATKKDEKKVKQNNIYELDLSNSNPSINNKIEEILNNIILLLNNVSTTENSVANLIFSEANKIKKILEISNDPNTILKANDSVKDIISTAADLELSEHDNLNILLESIVELEKLIKN